METPVVDAEALIEWPSDAEATEALGRFAKNVRRHYGSRLKGLYLFGSRARGEHRPDSDADVAVVLADGDWIEWRERWKLVDLAFDPSLDSGLYIQPWPFSESEWLGAAKQLIVNARQDALSIR